MSDSIQTGEPLFVGVALHIVVVPMLRTKRIDMGIVTGLKFTPDRTNSASFRRCHRPPIALAGADFRKSVSTS